jgi:uncharacterized protein
MRIYYVSDLHGSEKCWLKFLASAKFYSAEVIIVGGDITGKFIIPFIRQPNGSTEVTFLGKTSRLQKPDEIEHLKNQIAGTGQYTFDTTPDEYERYKQDPKLIDELFNKLLLERVARWVEIADSKLSTQKVRCFVSAGNDDMFEVDDVLKKAKSFTVPDGRVLEIGDGFEMLSLGYANITPWNCTRDIPEEELGKKIEALAGQVRNMDRAIFNLHVPPYDCGIDEAPKLTPDMQVVMSSSGEPQMIPVGSTAVREAIIKYQPMLGVHGHIHESKGIRKLGKTTVLNPGSEYGEGILRGVLIEVDPRKGFVRANLVSG